MTGQTAPDRRRSYQAQKAAKQRLPARVTPHDRCAATKRGINRGALEGAIFDDLAQHNKKATPLRWTKTAGDILTRDRRALNALDEIRGNRQEMSEFNTG